MGPWNVKYERTKSLLHTSSDRWLAVMSRKPPSVIILTLLIPSCVACLNSRPIANQLLGSYSGPWALIFPGLRDLANAILSLTISLALSLVNLPHYFPLSLHNLVGPNIKVFH